MEMKLEVVVVPVSDVDRAKRFHEMLGWRLDADFVISWGNPTLSHRNPPTNPTPMEP
jgi:catechol 2,3-dioxygenase-like lactoylglutathione lyase family enzyme